MINLSPVDTDEGGFVTTWYSLSINTLLYFANCHSSTSSLYVITCPSCPARFSEMFLGAIGLLQTKYDSPSSGFVVGRILITSTTSAYVPGVRYSFSYSLQSAKELSNVVYVTAAQ